MVKIYLMAFLLGCVSVQASEQLLGEEKKIINRSSCVPDTPCTTDANLPITLKEVGFWVRDYHYSAGEKELQNDNFYASKLQAWYVSLAPLYIEDFAFVQYVRGCIYSTFPDKDGVVTNHYNVVRQHLGKRKVYMHLDWEVDSFTTDPMYDSGAKYGLRHYFMEWNLSPYTFPLERGNYYGEDAPTGRKLFIRSQSLPPAFYSASGDFHLNHSLEYRTCLYRTRDIPLVAGNEAIPNPITCFEWRSSHVYNYETRKHESPKGIVKACQLLAIPDFNKPW